MSNPVDYAISRVMNGDIDDYLLKLAFEQPNNNMLGNWYNLVNQTTVAQGIREKVIHRTVLNDCNVSGGKTEVIDLTTDMMVNIGQGVLTVKVPDVVTGGRKIISVNEIYLGTLASSGGLYGGVYVDNYACGTGGVLTDATSGLINSLASNRSVPATWTNVHMTGYNSFAIYGVNNGTYSMSAKVLLEYDENLSSIHQVHYEKFAELVEFAVKAYIYRSCRRPVQEAVMRSGVTLDDIRDDIADYKDSWKEYKEYFKETWINCMAWSDKMKVQDTINMGVTQRLG